MTKVSVRYALYGCLGCLCVAVGIIGVVLPGVPTTGPMLLALACFGRSSERLHHWLLTHRTFGPSLQRWQRDRLIPRRAKVLALSSMGMSLAYLMLISSAPRWVVVGAAVFMLVGAGYILRCPHARSGALTSGLTKPD